MHVHVIAALSPEATAELQRQRIWCEQVEDTEGLERLVRYLSKPRDEWASLPDLNAIRRYNQQDLEQQELDACEALMAARRRGRLPRGSFTAHLPRLKADKSLPPVQATTESASTVFIDNGVSMRC